MQRVMLWEIIKSTLMELNMTTQDITTQKINLKQRLSLDKKNRLSILYFFILLIPFCGSRMLNMDPKTSYANILTVLNMLAMMAFFIQFPLASRHKNLSLFKNIQIVKSRS